MFLRKCKDEQFFLCKQNIPTEGVFVTKLSSNVVYLSLTNIVGYDMLLFRERFIPIGINPRNHGSFSVRHKKFDSYPGFSVTN